MKIQCTLQHPVSGTVVNFTLNNADPGGLVKVIQDGGHGQARRLVHGLAHEKMPTWMYQYDLVDWAFIDEDAPPAQAAA